MSNVIDYAVLIDEAMHLIVKKALKIAEGGSLPGEHHFFISFDTNFPGVILSNRVKEKYHYEMTIVLQFQYEELEVGDSEFSVSLSFDNKKERITIPFVAITAFADPSVKFGLQFKNMNNEQQKNQSTVDRPIAFKSGKDINRTQKERLTKEMIEHSGASNIIALDSFRKKSKT